IVVDLHHLLLAGLPAHFESYMPSQAVGFLQRIIHRPALDKAYQQAKGHLNRQNHRKDRPREMKGVADRQQKAPPDGLWRRPSHARPYLAPHPHLIELVCHAEGSHFQTEAVIVKGQMDLPMSWGPSSLNGG